MSLNVKMQIFGSALNFFLLFALVSSYSVNRRDPGSWDELDDDARAKLHQVVEEFNSGNEEGARELLEKSDLDPEMKKVVEAAFENEQKENPEEEKADPAEAEEDKNENLEAEVNDVDEMSLDDNKQDIIDPIPVMPTLAEMSKDGILKSPNVAKQTNIETEDDLNTQEAKKNFNAILETVKSATTDLEEAVKEGKVDMEKALQLTDLENVVSSFQNSFDQ